MNTQYNYTVHVYHSQGDNWCWGEIYLSEVLPPFALEGEVEREENLDLGNKKMKENLHFDSKTSNEMLPGGGGGGGAAPIPPITSLEGGIGGGGGGGAVGAASCACESGWDGGGPLGE